MVLRIMDPKGGGATQPKNPSWFQGDASQVQGFGKWAAAFRKWFVADLLMTVVTQLRAAKTWKEANLSVQKLQCVGPYAAAQGLCTLIFGAYLSDTSKIFGPKFDAASMKTWCGFGPGPTTSVEKMFGKGHDTLEGIQELCAMSEGTFERLELNFPYLVEADGQRRALCPVDLEVRRPRGS